MFPFTTSLRVVFVMVNGFAFGDFGSNEKSSRLISKSFLGGCLDLI